MVKPTAKKTIAKKTIVKKIAVLVCNGLSNNIQNSAALDMILAASTYEYDVSVVFFGTGVFTLFKEQDAASIQATNLLKSWKALPVYDVTQLYAIQEDLTLHQIHIDDLALPIWPLLQTQLHHLLTQQDIILRY